MKTKKNMIKIRHFWAINPISRIHGGKKGYNRNQEKQKWAREIAV